MDITARLTESQDKNGKIALRSTRTVCPGYGYASPALLEAHRRVPSMQRFGATKERPGLKLKGDE